jgi:multidrug transporter EmrE-like cation transporter
MVELVSIISLGGKNMKQVLQLPPWLFMAGFIMFQVSGSLLLRVASQRIGWPAFGWFAAGNIVGLCGVTCLTLTLRTQNPNLTFALCQGGAFCVLQFACYLAFRIPLRPVQWIGVAFIAAGVICVQWNSAAAKLHPQAMAQTQ